MMLGFLCGAGGRVLPAFGLSVLSAAEPWVALTPLVSGKWSPLVLPSSRASSASSST